VTSDCEAFRPTPEPLFDSCFDEVLNEREIVVDSFEDSGGVATGLGWVAI